MDDIKIVIPQEQIRKAMRDMTLFDDEVYSELEGAIRRATYRVAGSAMQRAPTGVDSHLRKSIVPKAQGLTGEVSVNVEYAGAVEFGSKPHVIKPKRKKALAFKPGAGFRFWDEVDRIIVRKVNHPGTKAQPYLRPAVSEVGEWLPGEVKEIIERAANR